MDPNELLKEFEKKFDQLLLSEKYLLDAKIFELFFQTVDDALENRLFLFLQDRIAKRGFTNNQKKIEDFMSFIAIQ